ncbi:hypothetical protein TsFJ059_002881 [Trichoderma semiorbis]|uniref:Fungal STAND N-terminal Goodbye domain-containing protein n=1 Tax=Trichoderma semiorbis TaxID=1491008 RepID=A0A9P8HFP6_9HYPO|nr:hypothetical protein TsFJ059_002881 [Trichoderma semiorbis]
MSTKSSSIPPVHLQPPSVDYIDNRLSEHHGVFKNTNSHYDHTVQKYVPDQSGRDGESVVGNQEKGQTENQLSTTSQLGDIGDPEKFWGLVFPEALAAFTTKYPTEPEGLEKLGYRIRDQTTWKGINAQLHRAREVYDGTQVNFQGRCKRALRKLGDSAIEPTSNVVNLVPNIEYISPVLGAVQLLLNAYKVASEVRERVTSSFDEAEIQELFNDAEVYLITFPDSSKVKDATISLVVTVMKAIEDAIVFFLSKQIKRLLSAFYRGKKGYQETLLRSLEAIKVNSEKLIQQAQSAHLLYTQFNLAAIRTEAKRFHNDAKDQSKYTTMMLNDIHEVSLEACNNVLIMLNDAEENKKRQLQILANQESILSRLEEISRGSTPVPPESLTWQPQQASQFQFNPVLPMNYQQYFQPVQPQISLPTGQLAWFDSFPNAAQPRPVSPQPKIISSSIILDLLNIPLDLDSVDLLAVKEYSYRLPRKYHTRAVQVTQTREFRQFIVAPTSRRLLIHGHFSPQSLDTWRSSPLSFFCFLLVKMLRERERYITLVFFCGFHVEEEDSNVGGAAIIRSFIAQLLQKIPFDFMLLDMAIDLDSISKDDCKISHLCDLFVYLVRHLLRQDRTLVCIIDGIGDYETDELESDMLAVVKMLLGFCNTTEHGNGASPPHGDVKVLATAPFSTESVQELFIDEGNEDEDDLPFLTMESFPDVNDTVGISMPSFSLRRGNTDELD